MDEVDGAIRPACAHEADMVALCVRAAYAPYIARIGMEPAPMHADYSVLIAREVVHVVAGPTGEVRGLVVLEPVGAAMFIENVAVHPRHQGQGLGRRLLAFAEEQARMAGLAALELYTNELMTENLALYARLGFVEVDRRLADGYRRVFLRKALT